MFRLSENKKPLICGSNLNDYRAMIEPVLKHYNYIILNIRYNKLKV